MKKQEGDKILSLIKNDSYVITLEIDGKQLSSEDFATKINSSIPFLYFNSLLSIVLYFLYYTLAWKKVCLLSAIAFSSLDILIYFIKLVSVLCPVICMIDKLGIPAL